MNILEKKIKKNKNKKYLKIILRENKKVMSHLGQFKLAQYEHSKSCTPR